MAIAAALGGDAAQAKLGVGQCMKLKWISINKADKTYTADASKRDEVGADAAARCSAISTRSTMRRSRS
jgi:hypothetical protein